MSLWWVKREQLDYDQVGLIEDLSVDESHLVTGPPGSGKTNVLLRRAQFVRMQGMPNVLVLTYTRALTEFVKTGCLDGTREIFPRSCVTTLESWLRSLYKRHQEPLPDDTGDLVEWKRNLALGAMDFFNQGLRAPYESLFVDEAQDLLIEEIELLKQWSPVLFLVGDDRQRIFVKSDGLSAARSAIMGLSEHRLRFHYRLAPQICRAADRVLIPAGRESLESTSHYDGPQPGTTTSNGPISPAVQLSMAARKLKAQVRVYRDLIEAGDRLGVVVARKEDRQAVFDFFEEDEILAGQSKIIRAREEDEEDYDPSLNPDVPVCILTVKGVKGLEFRAVHWLFCEELSRYHDNEHYYTVLTRAKTSVDVYYSTNLPQCLALAIPPDGRRNIW
jgi:superfamily I DNA/RNA helicase